MVKQPVTLKFQIQINNEPGMLVGRIINYDE